MNAFSTPDPWCAASILAQKLSEQAQGGSRLGDLELVGVTRRRRTVFLSFQPGVLAKEAAGRFASGDDVVAVRYVAAAYRELMRIIHQR